MGSIDPNPSDALFRNGPAVPRRTIQIFCLADATAASAAEQIAPLRRSFGYRLKLPNFGTRFGETIQMRSSTLGGRKCFRLGSVLHRLQPGVELFNFERKSGRGALQVSELDPNRFRLIDLAVFLAEKRGIFYKEPGRGQPSAVAGRMKSAEPIYPVMHQRHAVWVPLAGLLC